MTAQHLLPSNSTPIERAVSTVLDRDDTLAPSIDAIAGQKFLRPLTTGWAPWLITEYGLGAISGYFDTPEAAIDAGIAWQRLRGTPQALATALAWIGYAAPSLEDDPLGRRMWHRYQVAMGEVPRRMTKILFSPTRNTSPGFPIPPRSIFWRGFAGYDVRALDYGNSPWGGAIWGNDSGVKMPGGETLWSHGESHEVSVSLTAAQRAELSADVTTGSSIGWDADPVVDARCELVRRQRPESLQGVPAHRLPTYLGFFDGDGQLIGYRRTFSAIDVTADYPPIADTAYVRFTARTDFGEGFGSECGKRRAPLPCSPGRPGPARPALACARRDCLRPGLRCRQPANRPGRAAADVPPDRPRAPHRHRRGLTCPISASSPASMTTSSIAAHRRPSSASTCATARLPRAPRSTS